MKVCLTCSAGGHLTEMLQLKDFYKKHDYFFITFKRKDSETLLDKKYFVVCPRRNPLKLLVSFFQSLKILLKEKPDLIVSTGADVTVPVCFIGKLMGRKIVFIESFCRPLKPGISGKLVHPIADLFIVQWKEMLKFYPKAVYGEWIF
ncbi:MAG: PssD/Cps14F family polysaccharide biosynthesis glycosyltransferase [archaeon]